MHQMGLRTEHGYNIGYCMIHDGDNTLFALTMTLNVQSARDSSSALGISAPQFDHELCHVSISSGKRIRCHISTMQTHGIDHMPLFDLSRRWPR